MTTSRFIFAAVTANFRRRAQQLCGSFVGRVIGKGHRSFRSSASLQPPHALDPALVQKLEPKGGVSGAAT